MNTPQLLAVERIEFGCVKIAAVDAGNVELDGSFPQIRFDFSEISILTQSHLAHHPDELEDPKHFVFSYAIKIDPAEQKKGIKIPYSIEIEAMAFMRYEGKDTHVGADRFRAVRFSGYQILYGAIREMISNITARGRHGLWMLPARNFNSIAKSKAETDEAARIKALSEKATLLSDATEGDAKTLPRKKPKRAKTASDTE